VAAGGTTGGRAVGVAAGVRGGSHPRKTRCRKRLHTRPKRGSERESRGAGDGRSWAGRCRERAPPAGGGQVRYEGGPGERLRGPRRGWQPSPDGLGCVLVAPAGGTSLGRGSLRTVRCGLDPGGADLGSQGTRGACFLPRGGAKAPSSALRPPGPGFGAPPAVCRRGGASSVLPLQSDPDERAAPMHLSLAGHTLAHASNGYRWGARLRHKCSGRHVKIVRIANGEVRAGGPSRVGWSGIHPALSGGPSACLEGSS
jgi:hypothetical protein